MAVSEMDLAIRTMRQQIDLALVIGDPQSFFNNFNRNFPWPDGIRNNRKMIEDNHKMDTPHSEIYGNDTFLYSPRFLSQTPRNFFAEIDRITEELGYSADAIKEMVRDKARYMEFYKNVASEVFIHLIEMGYKEAELKM